MCRSRCRATVALLVLMAASACHAISWFDPYSGEQDEPRLVKTPQIGRQLVKFCVAYLRRNFVPEKELAVHNECRRMLLQITGRRLRKRTAFP